MPKSSDFDMESFMEEFAALQKNGGSQGLQMTQIRVIVEQFKPEVDAGLDLIDELVAEYGERLQQYAEKLRKKMVDSDIASMKEYKDAGINEEIAYRLIRDRADRFQRGIEAQKK